jgi:hypothetical protein
LGLRKHAALLAPALYRIDLSSMGDMSKEIILSLWLYCGAPEGFIDQVNSLLSDPMTYTNINYEAFSEEGRIFLPHITSLLNSFDQHF